MSKGAHGLGETSSREWKPYNVVRHRESAPPTTAASQRPASIMRRALANTLAVVAQAEETTKAGPSSPSRRLTKSASEPVLWVVTKLNPAGRAPVVGSRWR